MTSLDDVKRINSKIAEINRESQRKALERERDELELMKHLTVLRDQHSIQVPSDLSNLAEIRGILESELKHAKSKLESQVELARELFAAHEENDYRKMRALLGVSSENVDDQDIDDLPDTSIPDSDYDEVAVDESGVEASVESASEGTADIAAVFDDLDDEDDEDDFVPSSAVKADFISFDDDDDDEFMPATTKKRSKPAKATQSSDISFDDDNDDFGDFSSLVAPVFKKKDK